MFHRLRFRDKARGKTTPIKKNNQLVQEMQHISPGSTFNLEGLLRE